MNNLERIYKMSFASVYPHYVTKVEKKGRTVEELHTVIFWLTGYNQNDLESIITNKINFEDFFNNLLQSIRKDWNLFNVEEILINETKKFN